MRNENIEQRLNKMKGKTWMYNARNIVIEAFRIMDGTVTIVTDKGEFLDFETENIEKILGDFLPSSSGEMVTANDANGLVIVDKEDIKKVTDTLLENIEKVKNDPKYIPVANSINKSAQTIINMAKAGMEAKRLSQKI